MVFPSSAMPKWLTERSGFIQKNIAMTALVDAEHPDGKNGIIHKGAVGAIIGNGEFVITVGHAVKGATKVSLAARQYDPNMLNVFPGREFKAEVVRVSDQYDVALLRVSGNERLPNPMRVDRLRRVRKGETVWYFGKITACAFGEVTDPSVQATADNQVKEAIRVAVASVYGDSGGALVTDDGALIGILLGSTPDGKHTLFAPIGPALDSLGFQ